MALRNPCFKDQKLVSFEEEQTVEREREEEEEEEEKKRKERSSKPRYGTWIFGMETEFMYGFYEIMHEFPCFDGYPLAQI